YYGFLSNVLAARGEFDGAEQAARKAVALQPDDPANLLKLVVILDTRGHTDEAIRTVSKALALQPDYPGAHAMLAALDIRRGDPAAALRNAAKETDPDQKAYAVALARQAGPDHAAADAALNAYIDKYGRQDPPDYGGIAEMYALRKQPDAMFQWLQRGVAQHDNVTIGNLLPDSLLFPYQHDPRFAALLQKVGLPVPGETPPAASSSTASP
ncbi:MAG TPA: tetratricopeptide repeat protein, partial [Rhodanobacter sp.]|nr:tetratricopeptide repeat protein [Rhodanobacter sp.]